MRVIAGKEKRPSRLSWWNFVLLNAFVSFSDLFSFDQNHLTLVFKGMFFAVLKFACFNINPATCGERSWQRHPQLILNKSIPPGMPGTCSTSAVPLVPVQREKSRLQSYRFSHFVKILHVLPSQHLERQLSCSVWNAFYSPLHKKIFPVFYPLCWFSRQNQKCWLLGEVRDDHNVLKPHPGSRHFPPIPCTDPGAVPEQWGHAAWEETRRAEVGILWSWALCFVFQSSLLEGQGRGKSVFSLLWNVRRQRQAAPFLGPFLVLWGCWLSKWEAFMKSPWSCRKSQKVPIPGLWQTSSSFLLKSNLWILQKLHFLWTKRKQSTTLALTLSHVFLEIQSSFKYPSWELSSFVKFVLMFASELRICTSFLVQGLVVRRNNIGTKITASGLKFLPLNSFRWPFINYSTA